MKLYIDVTNLMSVNFVTGIQRVVREVVLEFLENPELELSLLNYENEKQCFEILDNGRFLQYFKNGKGLKNEIKTHGRCRPEDLEQGSVFFDIDSVWNARIRRSEILPVLKERAVKIAVFVHDIIPITHPQYCHANTTYFFMNYIGAYLQYADLIITSTKSTLNEIKGLQKKLGLGEIPGYVTSLGSDFSADQRSEEKIDPEVIRITKKKKYILVVGTIEPRKNHKILLDAFDQGLFGEDIHLIFAGRIGWNVKELENRINEHPQLNKKFFHISGANDATIDYLYCNAFALVFPTFNEGFGLPLIEAVQRGTPVFASDCEVLKEIGGSFCEYFNPNAPEELITLIQKYLKDDALYQNLKNRLRNFKAASWKEVSVKMGEALLTLKEEKSALKIPEIKQMVILSARDKMLLETLPFIEAFMPFIKEIVICCPDSTAEILKNSYQGRLDLKFLTDREVLAGRELPKDHSKRNFYLRCLAFQNSIIDDAFIMSDDDYRPLAAIDESVFVKNGRYQSYYCYSLKDWKGTEGMPTSYDNCMFRTYEFLKENRYPCMQYSSHMPQPVDKRIFCEMLREHRGLEEKGYDEWSTYFNYARYHYPDKFESITYMSLCWPGAPTDWELQVYPEKFLFENYYPEQYEEKGIFQGYSMQYFEGIERENLEKVALFQNRQRKHECDRRIFESFGEVYHYLYGEMPSISIVCTEERNVIGFPKFVNISKEGCTRFYVQFFIEEKLKQAEKKMRIAYFYTERNGNQLTMPEYLELASEIKMVEMPVYGLKYKGRYLLHIAFNIGEVNLENAAVVNQI